MSGWLVTDLISPSKIPSQQNALGGRPQLSINHTSVMQRLTSKYYWSAPEAYLGNKVPWGWSSGDSTLASWTKISEHVKKGFQLFLFK